MHKTKPKKNSPSSSSLRKLAKDYPLEVEKFVLKQLEDVGIIKEGGKVSFEFPKAFKKAASEGVDIYNLKNISQILDLKITGEPEQILYTYKIISKSRTYEITVTAIEFLRQCKLFDKKIDFDLHDV